MMHRVRLAPGVAVLAIHALLSPMLVLGGNQLSFRGETFSDRGFTAPSLILFTTCGALAAACSMFVRIPGAIVLISLGAISTCTCPLAFPPPLGAFDGSAWFRQLGLFAGLSSFIAGAVALVADEDFRAWVSNGYFFTR